MSFRAILGPNAIRQAFRRREDCTPRDQRAVHESSRLVFCVLFGIPVKEIHISDETIHVQYDTNGALSNQKVLFNCVQMIMSGVIIVQSILGQENQLFDPAVTEAQQLFGKASRNHDDFEHNFDEYLSTCSKATIAHLAEPNIRGAIISVMRVLNRERTDMRGEMLIRLLMLVRSKIAT